MEVRAEQREFANVEPSLARLAEFMVEVYLCFIPPRKVFRMSKSATQPDTSKMPTREYFNHLKTRAKRGDEEAAKRLKKRIEENPSIWQPMET